MHRQTGVTLLELMIAMFIGLIVLAGVSSVYLSSRQTARTNEAISRMQDSGRLAMELLANHVAHAGFYGRIVFNDSIAGTATDTAPLTYSVAVGTECAGGWPIDLATPLRIFNNTNPYATTCIDGVSSGTNRWAWVAGTDVLEVRNAGTDDLLDPPPVPPAQPYKPAQIHVIGDVNGGRLFLGDAQPPTGNYAANSVGAFEVNTFAYFIAQFSFDSGASWEPTLMRAETFTNAGALGIRRVQVIPGIEDMQLEIALDNNFDGAVDLWQTPGASSNFSNAKALRIWLLVRAPEIDTSFNADGSTITYRLGQQQVERNDNFRRLVLTRTVTLNNNL